LKQREKGEKRSENLADGSGKGMLNPFSKACYFDI
jgi:hypothetical protein